jgi:hypothetical protein
MTFGKSTFLLTRLRVTQDSVNNDCFHTGLQHEDKTDTESLREVETRVLNNFSVKILPPRPLNPRAKIPRYPLDRGPDGPQSRSVEVRLLPGSNPSSPVV